MSLEKSIFIRAALIASVSFSALSVPEISYAQPAERAIPVSQEMGEIVVTARKRQETMLDVPVVATAISQTQIERVQLVDLKDVAKLVPGLSMSQTLGVSGIQVSLRGVGTNAQNAGIDASVALNLDGMQITQGIAYSSAMFDLGQIEALKGPQALFFGKNSPGGVISIRSADPTDKFEVMARTGYEVEAAESRTQLVLSGPISDSLKVRIAGQYDKSQGYFKNNSVAIAGQGGQSPANRKGPSNDGYVIRGTVLWQPGDQFDARFKMNFTKDRQLGGVGLQLVSCPDGVGTVGPRNIAFLGGENCVKDRIANVVAMDPTSFRYLADPSGILVNDTRQQFGSLELNYRPRPDITVTSVTSYYHLRFVSQQSAAGSTAAGPGLASLVFPFTRRDVTEELRVNSDFTGPLNFTFGGFYQKGRLRNHGGLSGNTALGITSVTSNYQHFVNIETISGFGQARYKIVPNVELAAGARFTHETRDLSVTNFASGTGVPFPTAVPKISSSNWSPEVTLTFKPTDNITTFAAYKKGFKSGSFQLSGPAGVNPDLSFGDERAHGWEVGVKARTEDRSLFASLAFYDYIYKGLQVGVSAVPLNGVPVARTLNAGGAKVYGVDFDIAYVPPQVDGLKLNGGLEWNHGRFTDMNGVPCWGGQMVSEGCNQARNPNTNLFTAQSMTGQPLLRAPDWQANFGFDYERSIGGDLVFGFSNSNKVSSRYLAILGQRADFYQPGYLKSDITMSLKNESNRWEVSVIGKNVGDKLTSGGCANSNAQNGISLGGITTGGTTRGAAGVDEVSCYMDRGREVWFRVTLRPFN
jgi:outer membrane receptor protein involved in Fe transport